MTCWVVKDTAFHNGRVTTVHLRGSETQVHEMLDEKFDRWTAEGRQPVRIEGGVECQNPSNGLTGSQLVALCGLHVD